MSPRQLKALIEAGADISLIDIRERYERESCHIGGEHIPMEFVMESLAAIPKDKRVIVYCQSGKRGAAISRCLAEKGFSNVSNLEGGLDSWIEKIDPSLHQD